MRWGPGLDPPREGTLFGDILEHFHCQQLTYSSYSTFFARGQQLCQPVQPLATRMYVATCLLFY